MCAPRSATLWQFVSHADPPVHEDDDDDHEDEEDKPVNRKGSSEQIGHRVGWRDCPFFSLHRLFCHHQSLIQSRKSKGGSE